ncbi:hypothetical protein PG993_008471 [Apiospora rasikravindrae]|uniref:Uncharacterized protein n=1 Tax=Apiospora rasikravindrae TaxID=990691 RepID=A0ABR1T0F7_9PEZI
MEGTQGHFVNDVLDKNGDLILRITKPRRVRHLRGGPCSKSFLVDSRSLRRASEKWTWLTADASRCGQGCDHWVIHLDGDIKSHEILLNIIHGRFDKVHANFDHELRHDIRHRYDATNELSQLSHLACIAEEFEELHLLRPWIPVWTEPQNGWHVWSWQEWYQYAYQDDCLLRLSITWRLGEKEFFKEFTANLVQHVSFDDEARFQIMGARPHRIPSTLPLSNIERKRESVIKELLDVHEQFQKDWAAGLHRHCTAANATPAEKATCESEIQKAIAQAQGSAVAAELKAEHYLLYKGTTGTWYIGFYASYPKVKPGLTAACI